MTDAPPPAIGAVEIPDPRGPVSDDFKRGVCFIVRMMKNEGALPHKAIITIDVPKGYFKCQD